MVGEVGEVKVSSPAGGVSPVEDDTTSAPAPAAVPAWEGLTNLQRRGVVEALLFAAERPLPFKDLRELLGADRSSLKQSLEDLRRDLARPERGLNLVEVAGGYALRTRSELAPWMKALVMTRPPRISRAALEALAIIAYRQPVTRAEVEELRGVESGQVIRSLLEKRMVRILGRKNDIGRPLIYGTTREFLETFSLRDLAGLPPLAEVRELTRGTVKALSPVEPGDALTLSSEVPTGTPSRHVPEAGGLDVSPPTSTEGEHRLVVDPPASHS